MDTFNKFLQEHTAMRMLNDFLTARMSLITVYYRGLTYQRIIYRDGYNIWELMCRFIFKGNCF
ncbi:unnamed protein product [Meloidogyne enterolobii]|uniref:Uncharacterized protein n=1 Tax=Meloidogyne enterolobii TaxID=390850 RepID=A0ACB0YZJ8_MELEN